MATNFQRTVGLPALLLRHCKVVETIHAAEQEQLVEKFKIGKLINISTATNAVSTILSNVAKAMPISTLKYIARYVSPIHVS